MKKNITILLIIIIVMGTTNLNAYADTTNSVISSLQPKQIMIVSETSEYRPFEYLTFASLPYQYASSEWHHMHKNIKFNDDLSAISSESAEWIVNYFVDGYDVFIQTIPFDEISPYLLFNDSQGLIANPAFNSHGFMIPLKELEKHFGIKFEFVNGTDQIGFFHMPDKYSHEKFSNVWRE